MAVIQPEATDGSRSPNLPAARLAMEASGNFILVFVFGLAIGTHSWFAPLLIGVPVLVMVSSTSAIPRAYCNPALTLAILVSRRVRLREGMACWLAQSGAGLLAAASVRAFVSPARLEVTTGRIDVPILVAALALVQVITCALCYAALDVSVTERLTVGDRIRWPIAFGVVASVIVVAALASSALAHGLSLCNALTAVVSATTMWIYLVSQLLSGIVATVAYLGIGDHR